VLAIDPDNLYGESKSSNKLKKEKSPEDKTRTPPRLPQNGKMGVARYRSESPRPTSRAEQITRLARSDFQLKLI
jgi:hypothetical protein